MHSFRILFLLLAAFTLSCNKKSGGSNPNPGPGPVTSFTNPLLSSGPDPWVVQKDSFYYYMHTLGNRISIWRTKKMSELGSATPQTVWTVPATGPNSWNVWAPELHFTAGKWYLYYTAGSSSNLATQRTFVLENSNADPLSGTWTDKGQIGDPAANFFAIDGTTFSYGGKSYFVWSGNASATDNVQRIYIARMSNPWTLETARSLISSPTNSWETAAGSAVNEGPEILTGPTGKVFLVFSASGCWTDDYALGMLTLTDGADPLLPASWTKTTVPVFSKKPSAYGPGHNTFFKSKDGSEDWILYHANSQPNQGCGDTRNPRMQKFTWNSNGTPNFGEPVGAGASIQKPAGE